MNMVRFFADLFFALSSWIFNMKFRYIFAGSFSCTQTKLEFFSPEIVFALENKELLYRFRVHRKSAASAQTDGQTDNDERTVIHS